MKTAHAILTAVIAISLTGCIVAGKPKPAAIPAAPQPAPAPPPPAPTPQPLSLPQTEIKLPPEQPFEQAALDPAPTEVQPTPPPPTRPNRPKQRTTTAAPVAAPPAEPPAPPPTPPASATAPTETERGEVHEVLPAPEKARLKNAADASKRQVRNWLNGSQGRKLDQNSPAVLRIKSLLQTSDEKEEKGDMREAAELADHAVAYMRELQGGH